MLSKFLAYITKLENGSQWRSRRAIVLRILDVKYQEEMFNVLVWNSSVKHGNYSRDGIWGCEYGYLTLLASVG